ncbi:MAG: guanylate kinase [Patescibacteria group bacterium]|nr:guanylate kinase [Patescibacteria group bacterium]
MPKEKIIAIITGPSAVGKTSIAIGVLKKMKKFRPSTTYTTRPVRQESSEDKIMLHINEDQFRQLIDNGDLIEWAQVYGNFYGTSKEALLETLKKYHVLLNIDVQGAKIIKKKFPKNISIFILPEKIEDIKQRLATRKKMPTAIRKRRLDAAKEEIDQAKYFDYRITNYDNRLEESIEKIVAILKKYQ